MSLAARILDELARGPASTDQLRARLGVDVETLLGALHELAAAGRIAIDGSDAELTNVVVKLADPVSAPTRARQTLFGVQP